MYDKKREYTLPEAWIKKETLELIMSIGLAKDRIDVYVNIITREVCKGHSTVATTRKQTSFCDQDRNKYVRHFTTKEWKRYKTIATKKPM